MWTARTSLLITAQDSAPDGIPEAGSGLRFRGFGERQPRTGKAASHSAKLPRGPAIRSRRNSRRSRT